MLAQRKLYPIEYATPVIRCIEGDAAGIVASHSLIPDALFHAFSTFGVIDVAGFAARRRISMK